MQNRHVNIEISIADLMVALELPTDTHSLRSKFFSKYSCDVTLKNINYPRDFSVFSKEIAEAWAEVASSHAWYARQGIHNRLQGFLKMYIREYPVRYLDKNKKVINASAGIAEINLSLDDKLSVVVVNPEHFFNSLLAEKDVIGLFSSTEPASQAELQLHSQHLIDYLTSLKTFFNPELLDSDVVDFPSIEQAFEFEIKEAFKAISIEKFTERIKNQNNTLTKERGNLDDLLKYFPWSKKDLYKNLEYNYDKEYQDYHSGNQETDASPVVLFMIMEELMEDFGEQDLDHESFSSSSSNSEHSNNHSDNDSSDFDIGSSSDSGSDGGGDSGE